MPAAALPMPFFKENDACNPNVLMQQACSFFVCVVLPLRMVIMRASFDRDVVYVVCKVFIGVKKELQSNSSLSLRVITSARKKEQTIRGEFLKLTRPLLVVRAGSRDHRGPSNCHRPERTCDVGEKVRAASIISKVFCLFVGNV